MATPTLLQPLKLRALYANTRAILILLPWIVQLFVSDLLLSLLLPLSFVAPKTAYHVSSKIAYLVWRGIQLIFVKLNGARITRSGDILPQGESAVVLANHISWTDFYLIQEQAIGSGMLGRCRWFAKQQLKWVPFLGWGLWAMGMPLISRTWDRDKKELERVFRGPKEYRLPIWLVAYSESTRYTPQKFLETVQWCKANNKPVPKYTLYPRTRGFVATMKELRESSSVNAVYDLTLAYAHGKQFFKAPSMWETLSNSNFGNEWKCHVHVKRFPITGFKSMTDNELTNWLEQRWVAKGQVLEQLQLDLEQGMDWSEHVHSKRTNNTPS